MRPLRVFPTILLAATSLLAVAACGDYPSIADLGNRPQAADSVPPTVTLLDTDSLVELGTMLRVAVSDDQKVVSAQAILLDSLGRILWRSSAVSVQRTADTASFTIEGLPSGFPYNTPVYFTASATDAANKLAYAGLGRDNASMLEVADTKRLRVLPSRTLRLPGGGKIGGLALDAEYGLLYFTDTPHNTVGAVRLADRTFAPWSIPVGSEPGPISFHPFGWGPEGALAVMNRGGNDVSVVDVSTDQGGAERLRLPLPLLTVTVGSDSARLSREATSLLLACDDAYCARPVLYMGSAPLGEPAGRSALRSVTLNGVSTADRFDVLTPVYSPALESDRSVNVSVRLTDASTGRDSLLFSRSGRSYCGTMAFGSTLVAGHGRVGDPVFIAETGRGTSACGTGGRVLRFDRKDGEYVVSAQAVLGYDWDDRLRNVQSVDVNADASLALLRTGDRVFVTSGTLQRLGTVSVAAKAVSFVDGQAGGPGSLADGAIFAAATDRGIEIYETAHFQRVATLPTVTPIGGPLFFLRSGSAGALLLVGVTATDDGFVIVPTSFAELERLSKS